MSVPLYMDVHVKSAEWQSSGRSFAGIAYAHQLGITVGQAVSLLHLVCKVMTVDELRNTILFLPF